MCSFLQWNDANYINHWDILVFYNQWKMMSDLKMSDFVSFSLFEFTLFVNLRNFDFQSHWNTLLFLVEKRYDVRFEYVA